MKTWGMSTIMFLLLVQVGHAGLVSSGAREILEVVAARGGREAAQELAEFGGKEAVEAALQRVAKEGGDDLVAKAVRFGKSHGLSAIRTIERAPALYIKALDAMPANLVERALGAARRDPALVERIVSRHGSEALEIAARHRGVGADIVAKLGDDGIRMARNLTEEQAVILARHADDIARLPQGQRGDMVDVILKAPGRILDYLERHPRVFMTATGVTTLIALKDDVLGADEETIVNPDGSTRTRKIGFAERIVTTFQTPLASILVVIAGIVAAWGSVRVWGDYRRERARVAAMERELRTRRAS